MMLTYLLLCAAVFCWVMDVFIERLIGPYTPQMPKPPDLDDN